MTWLNTSFSALPRPAPTAPTAPANISFDLRPTWHYLADRVSEPVPDAAFSPVHRAAPLSAEEKQYLCFSIGDGVGKYIDLRAGSYMRHPPAQLDFPDRFKAIYTEAQKARFFAADHLDRAFTAEDDPVTEPSAHPGWWWNEWPGSPDMRQTRADVATFDQRVRHADAFFRHLRQAHGVLHRAIGPRAPAALRAFVDAQLRMHIDRARGPLSLGAIAMLYYPDLPALRRKVEAFRIESAKPPRPPPAPGVAATNRAIGDINAFYAGNTSRIMGAPFVDETPNTPALELLGLQGVVTFIGPHALADVLKYGPRQHRNARVSPDWKYGPQMMADADRFNRITIKALRFESAATRTRVPYARYQDIILRGAHYRIGDGPWRPNPHRENEDLEKAKYLRLTALIAQARGRYGRIRNRDDPQDPRDYTGSGWLQRWMKAFGFSSSQGEEHGAG